MLVFAKNKSVQQKISSLGTNISVGFVPTMGALHQGHLSLIENAKRNNDLVVVSIFVNPTQFDKQEDLINYPKTIVSDLNLLESVGCDIVYMPSAEEVYENNITSKTFDFDGLEHQMEGKFRTGHFDGVGTIVKRLFEIVQPTRAYFGEKDFQQLQIVKKLVSKYNIPVDVIGCPIHREANGLAMSSRNERLSESAREKAAIIYQILNSAKEIFQMNSAEQTIKFVENEFKKHPEFELEYFEIADEATLLPVSEKESEKKYRGFIAIFIENIRLIDNISLN